MACLRENDNEWGSRATMGEAVGHSFATGGDRISCLFDTLSFSNLAAWLCIVSNRHCCKLISYLCPLLL